MKTFFSVLFALLLAITAVAREPNWEGLQDVDADPDLGKAIGTDRLSEYLILNATPNDSNQLIKVHLLVQSIGELLADGSAYPIIAQDLARGDSTLRDLIVRLLTASQMSVDQANQEVQDWANKGASDEVRLIFSHFARSNPDALAALVDHLVHTPRNWSRVLAALDSVYAGTSPIKLDLVIDTVVRNNQMSDTLALDAIKQIKNGDVRGRWAVTAAVKAILPANGALVRYLSLHDPPQQSWYYITWHKLMDTIITDYHLRREYVERLSDTAPLYDSMRNVMADAIRNDSTNFVRGYFGGASIPDSRYLWSYKELLQKHPELKDLKPDKESEADKTSSRMAMSIMADHILADPFFSNFIMWHLTRASELTVDQIRSSLPIVLSNHEDVDRELAKADSPFGDDVNELVRKLGGYDFYPGKETEFYERQDKGTLEKEAVLQLGNRYGQVLSSYDAAWDIALDKRGRSEKIFRDILAASIESDTNVLKAWLFCIRSGNTLLKEDFAKYAISKNYTQDTEKFDKWLDSTVVAVKREDIVNNRDVLNFKKWFSDYMATPTGWGLVKQQLQLESSQVSYRLRQDMGLVLVKDDDRFWRIYGMITAANGPSVTTLLPKLGAFVRSTDLASFLLEEMSKRNLAAIDAGDPVWDKILSEDSVVPMKFMDRLVSGSTMGDDYRLGAMALMSAYSDPVVWAKVKDIAFNHLSLPPNTSDDDARKALFEQISNNGAKATPFIRMTMQMKEPFQVWRERLLNAIRYLGQAPPMADFIDRDPNMRELWRAAVGETVTRDPNVMKVVLTALAERQGEDAWMKSLAELRMKLIYIILSDRVLFEQLIVGRNKEFKEALDARLTEKLGILPTFHE